MKNITKTFFVTLLVILIFVISGCDSKESVKPTPHEIGDIIQFGAYQWRVLDVQAGRALIISVNVLEQRIYHAQSGSITWADCSLRNYLNDAFYNSEAFTSSDRSRIVQVTNTNANNQWYDTNGGTNTLDRIFLLSLNEVVDYFGDSGQLANKPTSDIFWIGDQYNSQRIATYNDVSTWWWLRSPGGSNDNASNVGGGGLILVNGNDVNNYEGGVRPALWISF